MDVVLFTGKTKKIILPSSKEITIRESNGADDELISTIADVATGDNINKFLASVIIMDEDLGRAPTVPETQDYKDADRWATIFHQRILTRGNELVFSYVCSSKNCRHKFELTEDLSLLESSIPSYPNKKATQVEILISSGKRFIFDILTEKHIKKQLGVNVNGENKNLPLTIRNIRQLDGLNSDKNLIYFGAYSSREMSEIRAAIKKAEAEFNPRVEIKCPNCGSDESQLLFSIPDFFWPGE